MYFYLQASELLSGKAFNSMSYILHFDVRSVSLIGELSIINTLGIFNEEVGLQPLLLLITINSFCNMYFYLQTS